MKTPTKDIFLALGITYVIGVIVAAYVIVGMLLVGAALTLVGAFLFLVPALLFAVVRFTEDL